MGEAHDEQPLRAGVHLQGRRASLLLPDFVLRLSDDTCLIAETKGQEDLDVALKDRRAFGAEGRQTEATTGIEPVWTALQAAA